MRELNTPFGLYLKEFGRVHPQKSQAQRSGSRWRRWGLGAVGPGSADLWVDSMCWPNDSSMLVVRSSPISRVRVAKPLDEAERLLEIGGPLELELVDRHPGAYRAHLLELALCHDEPPASYCSG